MTNKRSLFPPAKESQRREASVTLRFRVEDYERMHRVAQFSSTNVANLLSYVIVNTMLPMLEREMHKTKPDAAPAVSPQPSPTALPRLTEDPQP